MPSLELKRKINKSPIKKTTMCNSLEIMERTWDRDLSSKTCYFFDYTHEFDPFALDRIDIDKIDESLLTPVECKYIINQSQTYAKDFKRSLMMATS